MSVRGGEDRAGADRQAALADGEAEPRLQGHGLARLDRRPDGVAGLAALHRAAERLHAGHDRGDIPDPDPDPDAA